MNKFFEKTGSPKTSNEYCSIVLRIAQGIGLDKDNDLSFVVKRFDDIKKYFESLTLPTVQKYSMVLRKLVPLSISARAKTINPRPRLDRSPKYIINRPEEIPMPKAGPLRVNATRLNRKADPNIDASVLEQIETLTPTFTDKKGNPIDDDTKKLYKTNIKAVMKRFDPPQKDLNFLVSNPHNVINLLKSLGIHTVKTYYNSIVRYLPIARPRSA